MERIEAMVAEKAFVVFRRWAPQLFRLPKRHGHFVFSVIQSFLTSAVAAAIAHSTDATAVFLGHWARSWMLSWVTVLPIVLLATPVIRRIVDYVSR
jgi:hypothetical protein